MLNMREFVLGGCAGLCEVVVCHPLDILKCHLQARQRLLGGPVWLMLDDHGVVRGCSTSGHLGQAQALAHHLAGW